MSKINRRDFLRISGTIMGGVALEGISGKVTRAQSKGGTYIVGSHVDLTHLVPFNPGVWADETVIFNVHEPLFAVNEQFQLVPVLAKDYKSSPDGLAWTFHLRKGIPFHDGEEFKAKDVKYTYEWAMNKENGAKTFSNFEQVDRVEVVDDYTIKVILKQPYAPLLMMVATHRIVPEHYHKSMTPAKYNQHPMGTGPFKFKKRVPGDHLILEAFDRYWQGRPHIDYFKMVVIPEPSVRAMALKTGEIHTSAWPLSPEDTIDLMRNPNFVTYRSPGIGLNHYQMNNRNPLFQDRRVRQAMMYALDRETTVKTIMKGLSTVAGSFISPALPYYHQGVNKYSHNPEKAKKLLSEAGWKPGPDGVLVNDKGQRLEFSCLVLQGDELRGSQAEMDQGFFRKAGINMKIERQEVGTYLARVFKTFKYDLALYNWTYTHLIEPDPSRQLACTGSNNATGWCHKKASELMEKGLREINMEKRKEIYNELQEIFTEEVPFLYIQFWDDVFFMSKKLGGLPDPKEVRFPIRTLQRAKDYRLSG